MEGKKEEERSGQLSQLSFHFFSFKKSASEGYELKISQGTLVSGELNKRTLFL